MFNDCFMLEDVDELTLKFRNNIVNYGIMVYETKTNNEDVLLLGKSRLINHNFIPVTDEEIFQNIALNDKENSNIINETIYTFKYPGKHEVIIQFKRKLNSFNSFFYNCENLIGVIGYIDVSMSTSFESTFRNCKYLSNINALYNWNLSKAIKLNYMFLYCYSLTDIKPLINAFFIIVIL